MCLHMGVHMVDFGFNFNFLEYIGNVYSHNGSWAILCDGSVSLSLLPFSFLSHYITVAFLKGPLKRKSITSCKQAPGSLSLDNSAIISAVWLKLNLSIELNVMLCFALLKHAAMPWDKPHHPFLFTDHHSGLHALNQQNYSLQLRYTISMEVNQVTSLLPSFIWSVTLAEARVLPTVLAESLLWCQMLVSVITLQMCSYPVCLTLESVKMKCGKKTVNLLSWACGYGICMINITINSHCLSSFNKDYT